MEDRKIRVAITHGDTNGVGYEVIFKAFEDPTIFELLTPIIYGSPKVAAYHRKSLELPTQFTIISQAEEAKEGKLNLLTTTEEEIKVELGTDAPEAAEAARKAYQRAEEDLKNGLVDVLVAGPTTEVVANGKGLTIRMNGDLRVALATSDMSLKDVPEAITIQTIVEKGKILHTALRRDLRIQNPRIAVLALNPNISGGDEENEVLTPAINELEQLGIQAFGPYHADSFFGLSQFKSFDAVLAMYHDQGMIPFKTISPTSGIIFKAGQELIETTTGHDRLLNIAGKGLADEQSMRNAIYAAIDIYRNRTDFDAPLAHPLPKLYHEKRDESEKVRFAIPKAKSAANPKNEEKATSFDKKQ